MEKNMMLKVEHVSKRYRLGMIGGTTLREEMQRKIAKLRRQEDPTRMLEEQKAGGVGELFYALDDISFNVDSGEAVGIIGHNGAGKSTLLKLISQVTGPTDGYIELNGRVASMLEVGTGFHPELSGRENIYMNGAILGMTKAEIDAKLEDIIDFSECRQFIDTPVKRYSSGMYVKLAFSVAAHLESEIMIMDEVLAVGDAKFQEKCLGRMGDEAHGGRTVLYVSHNMNTIRALCNRVIVLDHGKKIYDGAVEEGISIYNGLKHLSSGMVDLLHFKRVPDVMNHVYSLKSLEVDTADSYFELGSKISGRLTIESPDKLQEAGIYFYVKSISDVRIARMDTEGYLTLEKGDNILRFVWDTSKLVPSKYFLSIAIIQKNSWGSSSLLDYVPEAYCFEITAGAGDKAMYNWDANHYGYYIGPSIQIK